MALSHFSTSINEIVFFHDAHMCTLKVAIMVESYCSSAMVFVDPVLLFEKYVG
jgi:hypothetical protein